MNQTAWPVSKLPQELYPNQIHVWLAVLDVASEELMHYERLLAHDELERAARFHFEKDKNRFIVGRGILRKLLSHYLSLPPQLISFTYTQYDKPLLAQAINPHSIHFNLSHSGGMALYAFSGSGRIGVDIEYLKRPIAFDQIALRFFSATEVKALQQVGDQQKAELFYQFWTRKEAFLKALGKGISFPLQAAEVAHQDGLQWSPVRLPADEHNGTTWLGRDLFPDKDFVAALNVEASTASDVLCWRFVH